MPGVRASAWIWGEALQPIHLGTCSAFNRLFLGPPPGSRASACLFNPLSPGRWAGGWSHDWEPLLAFRHAPGDLEGTRAKPTFHCLPASLRQGGDLGPRSPNLQPWKNRTEEAMIPTACRGDRQTPGGTPCLRRRGRAGAEGAGGQGCTQAGGESAG